MSDDQQHPTGDPCDASREDLSAHRYRLTVDALFRRAVKHWPDSPFVIDTEEISYRQMDSAVDQVARGLIALGVRPGDRVALWMSNIPEWIAVQFAVTRIGAVLAPINTRLRAADLAQLLADSGARVVVTQAGSGDVSYERILQEALAAGDGLPALEHVVLARSEAPGPAPFLDWSAFLAGGRNVALPPVAAAPDDLAYILYTSGSTSRPKGVMLSHASLNNALNIAIDYVQGDRIFLAYPLFAVTGCQNAVLVAVAVGGCLVLQTRFDPEEALDLIESRACTVIAGITQILKEIAASAAFSPDRVASVRMAAIFPRRKEHTELLARFGVSKATTGYGMTETSGPVTHSAALDEIGLEGREFPGDRIRLVAEGGGCPPPGEPGAIHVRTPHIMLGYFGDPEATAAQFDADGWFDTGDIGCKDAQGRLQWLGRGSEIIKSSGFNYAAQEVEMFLAHHADVADLALIGVPDPDRGEVGAVFVVSRDGAAFTREDLQQICRNRIASYKIPHHVIMVDRLPKTASGKVRKGELREWYEEMGGPLHVV